MRFISILAPYEFPLMFQLIPLLLILRIDHSSMEYIIAEWLYDQRESVLMYQLELLVPALNSCISSLLSQISTRSRWRMPTGRATSVVTRPSLTSSSGKIHSRANSLCLLDWTNAWSFSRTSTFPDLVSPHRSLSSSRCIHRVKLHFLSGSFKCSCSGSGNIGWKIVVSCTYIFSFHLCSSYIAHHFKSQYLIWI